MNDLTVGSRERVQLIEAYQKLPSIEQKIVRLFSVIYAPINRTNLLVCLNRVLSAAELLTSSKLKSYLDRLLLAGMLEEDRRQELSCYSLIVEIVTWDAVQQKEFKKIVDVINQCIPIKTSYSGTRRFASRNELVRELRIGIYRNDIAFVARQLDDYNQFNYDQEFSFPRILNSVCNNPFNPELFRTFDQELADLVLNSIFSEAVFQLAPTTEVFDWLQHNATGGKSNGFRSRLLISQLLLRGRLADAITCLDKSEKNLDSLTHWGWAKFLAGDYALSIDYFSQALAGYRKLSGKRTGYFDTLEGLFFIFALIQEGSATSLQQAKDYATQMSKQKGHWLQNSYLRLKYMIGLQQGDMTQKAAILAAPIAPFPHANSIEILVATLCLSWVDQEIAKKTLPKLLKPLYEQAIAGGYQWLALEVSEILAQLSNKYRSAADMLQQDLGISPLVNLIRYQEPWELCLTALTQLNVSPKQDLKNTISGGKRLVWFITFYGGNSYFIEPREQKINAKGDWSKGRPIAIHRLTNPRDFDYLTTQDTQICAGIESDYTSNGYYGGEKTYSFGDESIVSLIGHPLVFWADSPGISVEITRGEPALFVQKTATGISLQLSPSVNKSQKVVMVKETPTKLQVIEITAAYQKVADLLGSKLNVPEQAKDRVLAAIDSIASLVTVHSDIGGGVNNAQTVTANPQPHIHLLPAGSGLKAAVLVRPFDQHGPYFQPGQGGVMVIADIDGEKFQTSRSLAEEKQLAQSVIDACPTLELWESDNSEWLISDPEACLELLLELQTLADLAVVEWPEGEKLKIKQRADLKSFNMRIERQRDWFEASGELQLDDDQVLDMRQLMDLLAGSNSRFIPLGNGEFLALTANFRKQLDELRAFSQPLGKGVKFHPLAGLAMQDIFDEVGHLQTDHHWQEQVRKLQGLKDFKPQLPSTLQAELRDYQLDGFQWLAQLAYWGVGACLADDMGLGKTLQALALILTRAVAGPTLILAPTSVCTNWLGEVDKFAPTLKVIQLGISDRQQILDDLQPLDLLICSYGLLQQEDVADMLAEVEWETIVLDEAQAIKNAATKRSQAAMRLQGKFKLLTTGTPIENHLGELWNLFQFINPGLLGSLDNFNQKFANAIERNQDKLARARLKKLIQPFILRRTKTQVLAELPSRTEILLHVQLSKEEQLFYEALRREAIEKLTNSDANAGQKHLQVLAEIMRLRRACCNAQLVKPGVNLASSKLALFGETVTELLDNGHKALVFSQFVDHLQIVKKYLEEHKISYQYLDGSTPAKERKKRVDAFQAGEGDVFLISLKAGGTGLNLTAADYVIHLDPWWNPAVEDQASDRAHRIGQLRPVTIYRLVAKGTIEDKIVDLHQHKRDLANSLLEGTEMSGKISTDDLLKMIREG
jgi:SNF2 family DNA or RNA helicase